MHLYSSYADVETNFCQAYTTTIGASKQKELQPLLCIITTTYASYSSQIKCMIKIS